MESEFKAGDRVRVVGKDCDDRSSNYGGTATIQIVCNSKSDYWLNDGNNIDLINHSAFPVSSLQSSSESGTISTKHHRRIPLNMEV